MRMPARVAVACLVALIGALLGSCSGEHPRLIRPGETEWWAYSAFDVGANDPVTLAGVIRVCLDRPGRVEITDVSLQHSVGGLRVDAFATMPATLRLPDDGTDRWTLHDLGYTPGAVGVDQECAPVENPDPPASSLADLGVQFSKPSRDTARGANMVITYVADGRREKILIEFELRLCEGDGSAAEWAEECGSWPIERYRAVDGQG